MWQLYVPINASWHLQEGPLTIMGYALFVEITKSCSHDGCARIWVHNMAHKIVYQTNSMCNIQGSSFPKEDWFFENKN